MHKSIASCLPTTLCREGRFAALLGTLTIALLTGCANIQESLPYRETHPIPARKGPQDPGSRWAPSTVAISEQPEAVIRPHQDPAKFPDLWARIRFGFVLQELDSPEVERFAKRFARQGWLERLGARGRRYLYLLVIEAEKRKLPSELALLPIIESGLNPLARSPADAVGMCQFVPATGRRFGLHQSALADRRMDIACIGAMFDYLQKNAGLFGGDWHLALAAYNWGEGAVNRAIERNRREGQATTYLNLRMPEETRAYVPQLLAIKRLIAEPERYGVQLPLIANRPVQACDVAIPRDMDVDTAARLAKISVGEFQTLNPGVKRGLIPRATHPAICLPSESAVRFTVNLEKHQGPLASWTARTVASRTTLADMAKRYRTTPEVIRAANGIAPNMRLKAGSTVLVPRRLDDDDIPLHVAIAAKTDVEPDIPDTRRVTVRVKRRESLAIFANRHRVTLVAIRKWNPGVTEPLRAGQQLVLHVPAKTARPPATPTAISDSSIRRKKAT